VGVLASVAGIGSFGYHHLIRSGSTFYWGYSYDGSEPSIYHSALLSSFPSELLIGGWCSDSQASPVSVSALFTSLGWVPLAKASYLHTTAVETTYRWRARDLTTLNVSDWSPPATAEPTAPPPSGAIKYDPGICAGYNGYVYPEADTAKWAEMEGWMEDRAAEGVKHLWLNIPWYVMEPTTEGVYTLGFAVWDRILAKAEDLDVKIHFSSIVWGYGSSPSFPATPQTDTAARFPDYTIDNGGAYKFFDGTYWRESYKFWLTSYMTSYRNMCAEFGARYNGHARLARWETNEMASVGNPVVATFKTELMALVDTLAASWPNTWKCMLCNYFGLEDNQSDVDDFRDLIAYAVANRVTWAMTDMFPNNPSPLELIMIGAGTVHGNDFGTTDYRGVMPIICRNEAFALDLPVATFWDYAYNTMHADHVNWGATLAGQGGDESHTWTGVNGTWAYLQSQPQFPRTQQCPSMFAGLCDAS
jgi:hypothetical protein